MITLTYNQTNYSDITTRRLLFFWDMTMPRWQLVHMNWLVIVLYIIITVLLCLNGALTVNIILAIGVGSFFGSQEQEIDSDDFFY